MQVKKKRPRGERPCKASRGQQNRPGRGGRIIIIIIIITAIGTSLHCSRAVGAGSRNDDDDERGSLRRAAPHRAPVTEP